MGFRVIMLEGTHVPLRAVTTGTGWNGFHVPILTADELIGYWAACEANDHGNGEWWARPFADAEGMLRLPHTEADVDDRSEDTVWEPCGSRRVGAGNTFVPTYAVDGLLWVDYSQDD